MKSNMTVRLKNRVWSEVIYDTEPCSTAFPVQCKNSICTWDSTKLLLD